MNSHEDFHSNDPWILSHRGEKNPVREDRPYAWSVEKERTRTGKLENVATLFLTNSECPFHCLMCDLWKNTTNTPVAPGAIPKQIEWALEKVSGAKHLKLYNSGNFFDTRAIPEHDYPAIAALLSGFETIIVESHPKLLGTRTLKFRDMLRGELQVAMGLETVHPETLRRLNKRMTLDDFKKAAKFLHDHHIPSRAFILLRPPFMTEGEGIHWAKKSIEFAFENHVECCVVIPTRAGNGALEILQGKGHFSPPAIHSLEEVQAWGIRQKRGRVFADLWDIERFSHCDQCLNNRVERMQRMNLEQDIRIEVECVCNQND